MFKSFALAICLLTGCSPVVAAAGPNDEKAKADSAMDTFQFCAAAKIATLGKTESSEFLVEAALEACRDEAKEATEAFYDFARAKMHATPDQRALLAMMYAKEMHTRVVRLVIAFKSVE